MPRFFEIDSDLLNGEYSTFWNMLVSMIRLNTREYKHFWVFGDGIKEIMKLTDLSQTTVFRQILRLEEAGAIVRLSSRGHKNIYFIKKKNDALSSISISSFIKKFVDSGKEVGWLEDYFSGKFLDPDLDAYL